MLYTLIVYNFILIIGTLFSFITEHSKSRICSSIFRFFTFLVLCVPAAIRSQVGVDFDTYTIWYNHPDIIYKVEWGYIWLITFLHHLNCDAQWFFVMSSIITYIPLCYFTPKKHFCCLILFYILIYYFISLSYIRQAMSCSFIICGTFFWFDKKYFKFILSFIIAVLFHYSALIVFPIYFINKFPSKITCFAIIIIMLLSLNKIDFSNLIFNNPIVSQTKYGTYASMSINRATEIGSGIGIFIRLFIATLIILFYNKWKNKNNFNLIINFSLIYIITNLMATQIVILSRLRDTFYFVPILFISYLFYTKINYKKILILIILILHIMMFEKEIIANQRNYRGTLEISPYSHCL